jgi:alanine racemase
MRHYLRAQVSLQAVRNNLAAIRARLPAGCKLCAVVKADAYGHGLKLLLETIAAGADALAVATAPEALEVRKLGYHGVLLATIACGAQAGGELFDTAAEAIRHDVQLTVTDLAEVAPLQRLAKKLNKQPQVHIKIDTGMGRSGVLPAGAPELVSAVNSASPLQLVGVYTHFAASDELDKTHAEGQFSLFLATLDKLGPLTGVIRHAANSAAIADMPYTALDMVRPGIAIYGYQPSDDVQHVLPLRPALRLTAPILHTKQLPAGATCGYGLDCRLTRDSRIGIVPGGYADGVSRRLSGRCPVGIDGQVAAVLGRISMDQIIVDLTDHHAAMVGTAVELISPDLNAPNGVTNLARLAETIPYEIICRLGRRTTYEAVEDFG